MTSYPSRHQTEEASEVQTTPTVEDGVAVAEAIRDAAEDLKRRRPDREKDVDRLVSDTQKNLIDRGESDIAEALGPKH
ncbi:hypothetical protein ACWGAN_22585 [Streptomyces sp. NPDC054945]